MKIKASLILTLAVMTFFACKPSEQKDGGESTDAATAEKSSKEDASQITYQQVLDMVFDDEGDRIEWHGEESPNTLVSSLEITSEEPCGENECGQAMYLTSKEESKTIEVIIKGAYDLDGDIGYIARIYRVDPQQKISLGCSHLCYGGEAYLFDRQIVGSSYFKE